MKTLAVALCLISLASATAGQSIDTNAAPPSAEPALSQRVYRVDTNTFIPTMRRFLKAKDDQPDHGLLKSLLEDNGVVISSPSSLFYSYGKGTLMVRSTKGNLEKIERLLAELRAVGRSNQEARRLYGVEPFNQEHGELRTEVDHWVWEALTASRGHDMVAKVTFDEKGSVVNVDVQMLAPPRPEPVRNRDNQRTPGVRREKRIGPPEVMPK